MLKDEELLQKSVFVCSARGIALFAKKPWYFSNEKPKHELKAYLTKWLTPFVLVSAFACILLDVLLLH